MLKRIFPPALADETKLNYPENFDKELMEKECNGCGARGTEILVPDTIYGMKITKPCCIHDYEFVMGATYYDFEEANERFLINLNLLIDSVTAWWYPKRLARRRAYLYYDVTDSELGYEIFVSCNKVRKS